MFADRLKKYRKAAGLTQRDMAKKLFISQQAYAKYELGSSSPNPDMLADIASILNISANLLLNDESDDYTDVISDNNKANSPLSRINTITDRMTEMRLKAGLSREELAEKAGVSIDVIANLEEGKGGINGENVDRVAKALNTNFDYLMGFSDDSTPLPKSTLAQLAENPPAAQPVAYIFGSNGGRKVITDKTKIELIKQFAEFLDNNEPEQK